MICLDTEIQDISGYWTPVYIRILNPRIYLDTEIQDIWIYLDTELQDISGYWTPGFLVDATFEKIDQHNDICSEVQISSRIFSDAVSTD